MDVEWNNQLNTPIPLPMDSIYKLSKPRISEYSNIKKGIRLNNIDFSRLKVQETASANNNKILPIIRIEICIVAIEATKLIRLEVEVEVGGRR